VPGTDEHLSALNPEGFKQMIRAALKDFPFSVVATTLRRATTATRNDWGAICYCEGNFYTAKNSGPRRWWRLLCFGSHLWVSVRERCAVGGRMRCCARGISDDDALRHDHGNP
jgi:hypothetical protein